MTLSLGLVIGVGNGMTTGFACAATAWSSARIRGGQRVMIDCDGCGNGTSVAIDGYCLECAAKYAQEAMALAAMRQTLLNNIEAGEQLAKAYKGQDDG